MFMFEKAVKKIKLNEQGTRINENRQNSWQYVKTLEATFFTYFKHKPLTDGFSVEGNLIYAPVQAKVNTSDGQC